MSVTSSSVVERTEAIVKRSLAEFIRSHTGQDVLSVIDDIVLSYVVGIVESLDTTDDSHDVEQFTEMIAAYIPSFATINTTAVWEWIFELSSHVTKRKECKVNKDLFELGYQLTKTRELKGCYSGSSGSIESLGSSLSTSPAPYSSSSRSRSTSQSDEERLPPASVSPRQRREELSVLSEMFPHLSPTEVQQSLSASSGDCQRAAQLLLMRNEEAKQHHHNPRKDGVPPEDTMLQDKKLREQILNRYGFIDKDDDEREHKPVAPKSEPKKMIRYRDNKIVSVKGERYSEVKSEEENELKKTFVTLKPARQYRFH